MQCSLLNHGEGGVLKSGEQRGLVQYSTVKYNIHSAATQHPEREQRAEQVDSHLLTGDHCLAAPPTSCGPAPFPQRSWRTP